ncbi:hypothetical protein MKW92_022676 [Papaver armeniacum]|nr:hypothetical protein MKW92_022676 [Papaver armeniacum]
MVVVVLLMLLLSIVASSSSEAKHIYGYGSDNIQGFIYNGFKDASSDLSFGNANFSVADITSNGVLRLTNSDDGTYQIGHAFYSHPLRFKQNSSSSSERNITSTRGGSVFSFSTSFVFSIVPESPGLRGQGISFVIAPQAEVPGVKSSDVPGLFDTRNNGQPTNTIFAVELDTITNREFDDIQGDHVGIDINNLRSVTSKPSGYYTGNNNGFRSLSLISGDLIRVWIEYDGVSKNLSVTLAPLAAPKPDTPLLFYNHDLSDIFLDSMYVGFSASTSFSQTSHYILGWSFKINGTASPLDLNQLPELPRRKATKSKLFGVELQIIIPVLVLTFIIGVLFVVRVIRNGKFEDVVEDWELEYGRQRRPIELHKSESEEGEILVDWVLNCWRRGEILQTSDPNLGNEYVIEEMDLVLKLGLLCSHNDPKARPSMRQVIQYLEGELPLPQTELWVLDYNSTTMTSSCIESVSLSMSNLSSSEDSLLFCAAGWRFMVGAAVGTRE